MSKKSKSKKKNGNKTANIKKSVNKLKIILPIAVALAIAGIIVAITVANLNSDTVKIKNGICDKKWVPAFASDASGDEVDMAQIYSTNYSSYQGSLEYFDDDTFSFWLSPGVPDDGTHSGKYEVADNKQVNMYFDDGTNTQFDIKYEDSQVISIEVNYDDYEIVFMPEEQ